MKEITVEPTRDKSHGDFATNLALFFLEVKKPSRELATSLQLSLSRNLGILLEWR